MCEYGMWAGFFSLSSDLWCLEREGERGRRTHTIRRKNFDLPIAFLSFPLSLSLSVGIKDTNFGWSGIGQNLRRSFAIVIAPHSLVIMGRGNRAAVAAKEAIMAPS